MSIGHNLTIFEGPDGVGKTTAAKEFARWSKAVYVHFGPYKELGPGELAKIYVDAMMPALAGLQPVVFDRSWLSERPYANVFRGGVDRLTDASRRQLERLAMRCGAVVVSCRVDEETMIKSFTEKAAEGKEYLNSVKQLKAVAAHYRRETTQLPVYPFDWTKGVGITARSEYHVLRKKRLPLHFLDQRTAGNLKGITLIVGGNYSLPAGHDAKYIWPFGSFSDQDSGAWLTDQLASIGIDEAKLCWVNWDQPRLYDLVPLFRCVITLGDSARDAAWPLYTRHTGSSFMPFPHPAVWDRSQSYPLTEYLNTLDHLKVKEPVYVF